MSAMKLQEMLNGDELDEAEKLLVKSHPKKNEKHGASNCKDTHVGRYAGYH